MSLIVAAAIVDNLRNPSWILCCQRSAPPSVRGKWELPGGHVEIDESPVEALHRELKEEIGITVNIGEQVKADLDVAGSTVEGDWPLAKQRLMRVWMVEIVSGTPKMIEDHMDMQWRALDDLDVLPWIGPDRPIIEAVIETARWRRVEF